MWQQVASCPKSLPGYVESTYSNTLYLLLCNVELNRLHNESNTDTVYKDIRYCMLLRNVSL